jgi:hypothetical protein
MAGRINQVMLLSMDNHGIDDEVESLIEARPSVYRKYKMGLCFQQSVKMELHHNNYN